MFSCCRHALFKPQFKCIQLKHQAYVHVYYILDKFVKCIYYHTFFCGTSVRISANLPGSPKCCFLPCWAPPGSETLEIQNLNFVNVLTVYQSALNPAGISQGFVSFSSSAVRYGRTCRAPTGYFSPSFLIIKLLRTCRAPPGFFDIVYRFVEQPQEANLVFRQNILLCSLFF